MGTQQPLLFQLQDAVVRRNGKKILEVPDFKLHEQESLALLGPNGAGKSTFIQLISREVAPLYREKPPVLFRGKDRCTLQEIKQSIGLVSATMQDQIAVHMKSLEIVCGGYFGTLGVPRPFVVSDQAKQQALKVMDLLGIAEAADRDALTLSSGQKRRILFARALVNEPDVLVLDEPCNGLDPQGMFHVRRSMRTLAQSGTSIILVTHYPEDIIPEIKRIVMIKNGEVFADGSKSELLVDQKISALFDVDLSVHEDDGYYTLYGRY